MSAEVRNEHRDGVAVLTMGRPVANALAPSLRSALYTEIGHAIADADVRAIVLAGSGPGFSSGVDIAEYDGPLADPWIDALCQLVEISHKPVVAALHGDALGAGFELALAAHGRVAARDARVALPDVRLGLVPGGGATQRLPRLVGAQVALQIMLSGQRIEVSDNRLARVFDQVVDGDPLDAAITLARHMATAGGWLRVCERDSGFSDPQRYQAAIAAVTDKLSDEQSAEAGIVKCVEAAQLLPFERGLAFEKVVFSDCLTSGRARARRHFLAAERRAAIMPELAKGRAHPVREMALVGGGDLMVELAIACLDHGLQVALVAPDAGHSAAIETRIRAIYDGAVARQRLTADKRDERLSRFSHGDAAEAIAGADLILDRGGAVGQTRLETKPGAIRALLDSSGTKTAGDHPDGVALRVYRPAHSTRLVELAVSDKAGKDAVATLVQVFGQMGRTIIRCAGDAPVLGHRLSAALFRAALALVQTGVSPFRVDAAARDMGFAAGPFQMMDRDGLEVVEARLERLARSQGEPLPGQANPLAERIGAGAAGRAAGVGFYRYEGKDVTPEQAVTERYADDNPAIISDVDLGHALHAALVNEGAALLAGAVIQRASDVDVVMVRGYGFDTRRGGPMLQADLRGVFSVLTDMKRFAAHSAPVWTPHALIEEMVRNGDGFFGRAGA